MSDLLRRASAAEPDAQPALEEVLKDGEPAPATPPEGLSTLTAEIARAIDHSAASESWERQRRGERHAFTRRLYTLQGQQTYEEIRRKYQRDDDFRGVVDRYLTDFEQRLAEHSDPDSSMAQLLSDSGKVYTMFAHASGRLD
jgi:hypothetical protein